MILHLRKTFLRLSAGASSPLPYKLLHTVGVSLPSHESLAGQKGEETEAYMVNYLIATVYVTSVSKKPGQTIDIQYHYCGLSSFF